MISRRQLFGGLSLLPLSGGLASCAARAMVAPPTPPSGDSGGSGSSGGVATPPDYVAPGPNWNGTAKSGGVPAVFSGGNVSADPIPRSTAKPAIHWVVPSGMVLAPGQDIVIGVDADAGGTAGGSLTGVKQVDFWVEGTTHTVSTPQFYTWIQNGVSKTCWGYFIMLRQSDFAAHLSSSEVRIFATAIPNDTTMQNRVIGYDLVASGLWDGNYPMSVFPRATANDKSYTVNPANNDVSPNFTTIKKAMAQAAADSAEFPLITITATANYEAENLANHAGGHGFCTVTSAAGVTATIQRAAAFTPNNPASWNWTPGWDAIEFRGNGIVFQQRNWTGIVLGRSSWFNGCKWTNSIGARDTNYWNGSAQPYVGPGPLMCWVDGTYAEHVSGMYLNNYYAINAQVKNTGGSCFTGNFYLYNTYVRDFDNAYFRNSTPRLSITFTNSGGHMSAEAVRLPGSSNTTGQNLLLKVDGVTVATIPLGFYSTDTNANISALATAINAVGAGWSASVLNSGGVWPASTLGFNGSSWSFDVNVFNQTANLAATPDPHGEWIQMYGAPSVFENIIVRSNILRDCPTEIVLNLEGSAYKAWDNIFKGNIWLGTNGPPQGFGCGPGSGTGWTHFVFENNIHKGGIMRQDNRGANTDPYNSFRNNIVGPVYGSGVSDGTVTFQNSAKWVNNLYCVHNNSGPMNNFGNTGNIAYDTVTGGGFSPVFDSLFVDAANGDMRPAAGKLVLASLKPRINTHDQRGLAFAASDVVGAWAQAETAPNYPF